MKRHLFSIVLAVLLLACASSSALAAANQPVYDASTGVYAASSTEKRNVFEFCDLFSSRLERLKDEYSFDGTFSEHDFTSYGDPSIFEQFNFFSEENQYYAKLRAGSAFIHVPDFTIDRITFDLADSNTDKEQLGKNIYRAIAFISALEYNDFDDYSFQLYHSVNYNLDRDSVDTSISIYTQFIGPNLSDSSIIDRIEKSTSAYGLLVYSGRYDYYLDYHEYKRDNGNTYFAYKLIAISK